MSVLNSDTRRVLIKHPLGWIAAGFGAGFSPKAPGTVGSLLALLPWYFLMRGLSVEIYIGVLLLSFLMGIWASKWVIDKTHIQDPGFVVWDEFVGLWTALFLAPAGWLWLLAGFALFRFFDIVKPWPVSWADRELHGGFGVMLDDVLAGLYAFVCLQLAAHFLLN